MYTRKLLSGPKPERRSKAITVSYLFRDWTAEELETLDVIGSAIVNREAESRDMERRAVKGNGTGAPNLPVSPTQSGSLDHVHSTDSVPAMGRTLDRSTTSNNSWPIRDRIRARTIWKHLWAKSAGADDFRTQLVQRLLDMLIQAERAHDEQEIAHVRRELEAMGAQVPE